MRLQDQAAAIMGGASGIGLATAHAFVREGASVALGDINIEGAERAAAALRDQGATAHAFEIDGTQVEQLPDFVAAASSKLGPLSVWVGSVGGAPPSTMMDLTPAAWRQAMALNVEAIFFGAQAAASHMIEHGGGSIINIASMYGFRAVSDYGVYCTGKAAVVMLTKCMGIELAEHNVRVNSIAPGYTKTPPVEELLEKPDGLPLDRMLARVPQGRLAMPDDIGDAILFLASNDARFMNGHCLIVDGGWTVNGSF